MAKTPIPTNAGMIHFYENVKPGLAKKHQLALSTTLTEFEIHDSITGKLVATGDSIQWLAGFINGLDVATREK